LHDPKTGEYGSRCKRWGCPHQGRNCSRRSLRCLRSGQYTKMKQRNNQTKAFDTWVGPGCSLI
jgi:hypothetical protein